MNINPVNHVKSDKNRYCGPSAISIVTGMATGEAVRLLRHVSGRTQITGTHDHHMARALKLCGITMKAMPIVRNGKNPPTLAKWISQTTDMRSAGRVFLVAAGNHWQIITGRRFCCGLTKEIVGFTHEKVKRRAKVADVYELIGDRIVIPAVAKKATSPAAITAKDRSAFASFCHSYKLRWSRSGDGYIEIDPCDDLPEGLCFLFDDWPDSIAMVRTALNDPLQVIDGYLSH